MALGIILAMEIMSMIVCIHYIYRKRAGVDAGTILLFAVLLVLLYICNYCERGGLYSYMVYVVIFFYCRLKFKSAFMKTVFHMLSMIITLTAIQFVCILFLAGWISNETIRALAENGIVLCICIFVLPRSGLNEMRWNIGRKNRFLIPVFLFMCLVIMAVLAQGKIKSKIRTEYFLLAVPAILMLQLLVGKWDMAQKDIESLEEEKKLAEDMEEKYKGLVLKAKEQQHGMKNHLAAMRFMKYTGQRKKGQEQEQEDYYYRLVYENRYNILLLFENHILSGFIYEKMMEAEEQGVAVICKGATKIENMDLPVFYLVEMLGILLDNAVEAAGNEEEKNIYFFAGQRNGQYRFTVRNSSPYIPYNKILSWFQKGESSKGAGRGMGLYRLKCLCEEWGCSILCRNVEEEGKNRIEFVLKIKRADSR